MINTVLFLWLIQGVIAFFQGRILYHYSLMNGPYEVKRVLLTIVLLYAAEAVSMAVLLIVLGGKKLLQVTKHAFWATVLFPAIATVLTDFQYIRVTGEFMKGITFLFVATIIYLAAGIGLSLLLVRIYGHRGFRPFVISRSRSSKAEVTIQGLSAARHRTETGTKYKTRGFSEGRSYIVPDYRQEYIDHLSPEHPDLRPVKSDYERTIYSGGSRNQLPVAYINNENLIMLCEEGSFGYQRLGRIAPSGKIYEITGRTESYTGSITPAGYVRNAAGLEVGCVDEEGNVFRYEGLGARDMAHAKTLIGKVNPGDLEAGAALILLVKS